MEKGLHKKLIQQSIRTAIDSKLNLEAEYLSTHCCKYCYQLNKVKIPMKVIDIKNPPVPIKKCTRDGGCTCTLLFRVIK